jgi:5-methylthioadenosine/S-adenosylhomocysteine deaminase
VRLHAGHPDGAHALVLVHDGHAALQRQDARERHERRGLAPGAKADIIVVDLRHLHYGAVHDPIKALVDCGSGRDVDTVIVDGQVLVEDGRAVRVDEPALLRDLQAEGERLWKAIPQWHWTARPLDEIVPSSYPVRGAH